MRRTGLPVTLRVVGRPVILIGEGEAADAKRRLLERAGAVIVGQEADARLAIVALENDADAEASATRLRARGILVNVVDRPALCDFTLPAIVDRDPVLVSIATGGVSAGLAAALRQRLETLLPASLGKLADGLEAARERMRARWPDGGDRRRALGEVLQEAALLDPLSDLAAATVAHWPAGFEDRPPTAVFLVLRSPDPDDLTLREARLLAQADRVFHNAQVPEAILARARADAPRIPGSMPAEPGPGLSVHVTAP